MGGNEAQSASTRFGVSLQQLRDLMDARGAEAVEKIRNEFGGINGLCSGLHTSANEGRWPMGRYFRFICVCV